MTAGMAIYDTMQYIKCDVSTVCIGMAASMGAFLLSGGAKGKRFALPNAEIMIHQPLWRSTGTGDRDSDRSRAYPDDTRKTLNSILAAEYRTAAGSDPDQIQSVITLCLRMRQKNTDLIDEVIARPLIRSCRSLEVTRIMAGKMTEEIVRCSFCNKTQAQVTQADRRSERDIYL